MFKTIKRWWGVAFPSPEKRYTFKEMVIADLKTRHPITYEDALSRFVTETKFSEDDVLYAKWGFSPDYTSICVSFWYDLHTDPLTGYRESVREFTVNYIYPDGNITFDSFTRSQYVKKVSTVSGGPLDQEQVSELYMKVYGYDQCYMYDTVADNWNYIEAD